MLNQTKLFFLLFACLLILLPGVMLAGNPWKIINEDEINSRSLNRQIVPDKYLTLHLAMDDLKNILQQAPLRFSPESHQKQVMLQIPMPDGTMESFQILEAPIMHPDLARKYPMLHSYVGTGMDDPTASIRFDLTQFGFHAMVLSGRHEGVFIDPYSKNDTQHYISYYQKDFSKNTQYKCHFVDKEYSKADVLMHAGENVQSDGMLRTYRLALACTGEYADFHGGTKAAVMAAFHTTMTRVNGIFEKDVAITMELIANTDELIFLDAATDPYLFEYPVENQAVCDDIVGTANYDIGHALGVGAGGAAERSSCCVEGLKAEGYSTLLTPVGDPFDINFVTHEFGHQFGCSHTANGNCNNTPATSVEPGNAYSVMGQDFFCDPIIEEVRGAYFHAINILEINAHLINGPAGSCALLTNTGNTPPTVDGGNAHYHLPVSTPFKLTAQGMDDDGDSLTYCWEQMDNEKVTDPPVPTNAAGPAFRSYEPVEEPHRYFPSLEYIVNGTDYLWEVLPGVSRMMDFRVTARDNFTGGGCTAKDDVDLTFTESAGPFLVQSPNVNDTWHQGALYTVSWDVANTDKAPVSCADVDILLSLDGGYTYPILLAEEATNDGSYIIQTPQVATSMARVMVVCSDNIFFDISDENFSIEAASTPTFNMAVDPPTQVVCGLEDTGMGIVALSAQGGFNEEITLSAVAIPPGGNISFSPNPVIPPAGVQFEIEGLENVAPGDYTLNILGTSASATLQEEVMITVNNELPELVNLISPANGATNEPVRPVFSWEAGMNTTDYQLQIATNPRFENTIVESILSFENELTLPVELEPLSVYYWRIIPINDCGEAETESFHSFQTGGVICKQFTNLEPAYIHGFLNTASSAITIEEDVNIVDLNVSMELFHKLVGDLKATLTAPSGVSIELFDRPGVPDLGPTGCTRDDLLITFDDEASSTSMDFENTCNSGTAEYAIEGEFQPVNPLSALNGQSTKGDWVLTITDEKFSHAGAVDSWSLEFCQSETAGATPDFSKMNLFVPDLGSETISLNNLSTTSSTATPEQITYTILSLPTEGVLLLNGQNVTIGTTFSQEEINNNLLSYSNTNPDALLDQFSFDIETSDGNWIPNEFLTINIGEASNIIDPDSHLSFTLFPNPANEEITLTISQPTSSQLSIMIYDVLGNLIKEIETEKRTGHFQQEVSLHGLQPGSYFLFLTDGKSTGRQLFIKN